MCIYIYICVLYVFFISCSIFIEDRHKISIMGRSELKELSEQEFAQILKNQGVYNLRGGALNDINIFRTQKRYLQGSGLLSTFASLGKLLLPAIRRFVVPAVGSFTSGLVKDVSAGKNFKESVKYRSKKNLKKMGSKILSGRGLKRKGTSVSSTVKKKKVKNGKKSAANKKRGHGLKKKVVKSRGKKKKKANKKRKYHDIFS